jgi:hypothetical protein
MQLGEVLSSKGWNYAYLIKPAALHFCFTMQHASVIKTMCVDLLAACDEVRAAAANGTAKLPDKAKIYGAASLSLSPSNVAQVLLKYQDAVLST